MTGGFLSPTMYTMKITQRTDAELVALLRQRIAESGSAAAWARANGFTRGFISDVMAGTRNMTERLAEALGFRRARLWEEAGPCG